MGAPAIQSVLLSKSNPMSRRERPLLCLGVGCVLVTFYIAISMYYQPEKTMSYARGWCSGTSDSSQASLETNSGGTNSSPPAPPGSYLNANGVAINVGGNVDLRATDDTLYRAEVGAYAFPTTGKVFKFSYDLKEHDHDLFTSVRYGTPDFTYTITGLDPNRWYKTRLLFRDPSVKTSGERMLDAAVWGRAEGPRWFHRRLDVVREGGGRPIVRSTGALQPSEEGEMHIALAPTRLCQKCKIQDAFVNAIQVVEAPAWSDEHPLCFSDNMLDLRGVDRGLLRIKVTGIGCRTCYAGEICSFTLKFGSNTYFDTDLFFKREIVVTLTGPTLHHATITPIHASSGVAYVVSYRVWDVGAYEVLVEGPCSHVIEGKRGSLLAQFGPLHIVKPPQPLEDACSAGQIGRWKEAANLEELRKPYWVPEPTGEEARDNYLFRPYLCLPSGLQPLPTLVQALNKRGIRFMQIVGNSHQRMLYSHIQTLLVGKHSHVYHSNSYWNYTEPGTGATLRLEFIWMAGAFKNGEDQCDPRPGGEDQVWSPFDPNVDAVLLNAAAWTFEGCSEPEASYAKHMPRLLNHYLAMPRKNSTRLFWRSGTAFPSRAWFCWARRRVQMLSWANEFARTQVARTPFRYLDVFPVEAARYDDTCLGPAYPKAGYKKDNHYSCGGGEDGRMHGVVGEAVARSLLHMIVNAP